eukprot:179417-Prymnesium_polylepis.1
MAQPKRLCVASLERRRWLVRVHLDRNGAVALRTPPGRTIVICACRERTAAHEHGGALWHGRLVKRA